MWYVDGVSVSEQVRVCEVNVCMQGDCLFVFMRVCMWCFFFVQNEHNMCCATCCSS